MNQIRSVSCGGGWQSSALTVLAAQRRINYDLVLFANTGDDSEDPLTLEFVRTHLRPYAEAHGVEFVEVQKTIGDEPDTILKKIERTEKSEVIPVRTTAGGKPMSRSCTVDFKIEVMGRELRRRGAGPGNRAVVAIGISLDEVIRASRSPRSWEQISYPLLGIPDLPDGWTRALSRDDCGRIIRDAGLPLPVKSACWFCPFSSYERWQELRRERPVLFQKACDLEARLTQKAGAPRYLTRYGIPLAQAIDPGSVPLFALDEVDDLDNYSCTSAGMCSV